MACCVFMAYAMNRFIQLCNDLDIKVFDIKYNVFDRGYFDGSKETEIESSSSMKVHIQGMTCVSCAQDIESSLQKKPGILRCSVSYPLSRASIFCDAAQITAPGVRKAIEELGYDTLDAKEAPEQHIQLLERTEELRMLRGSFMSSLFVSSIVATVEAMAWSAERFYGIQSFATLLLLAMTAWVLFKDAAWIHKSAWPRGRLRLGSMDALISLSLILGFALLILKLFGIGGSSRFTSTCFLAVVVTGGRLVHVILRRRSHSTLTSLFRLQAEDSLVWLEESREYVPAVLLQKGDRVRLRPGSLVPCDSYVIDGESLVDESSVTGESARIVKKPGDFLLSGTRNLSNPLTAIVYKKQADSFLMSLVDGITTAVDYKTESEDGIGWFLSIFVKTVLFIAALPIASLLLHPLDLSMDHIVYAMERSAAILASACPCGLGLAVPSAVMIGIDAGWRNGIIISRGARTMKALAGISHVVLDKTGTLTTGEVRVSSVHFAPRRPWTDIQIYRMLAAAEAPYAQRHPIAKAVFQYSLRQLNLEERAFGGSATDSGSVLSSGIQCRMEVDGDEVEVHVGSEPFLREHRISMGADVPPTSERTTSVYFAINSEFCGSMALQDTVRDEALSVIAQLKDRGYHVSILTGDVDEEAERVSKELDIPVLGARSTPHQKEASVRDLQSKGHKVVMVGDGINDTLAQAAADSGVLLASSWASNVGAADAMIVSPDLNALSKLLSISRKVTAQARFNVWYSMAYNVVALALASGLLQPFDIVITPSTAGTLMSFSSVSVLAMGSLLWKRLE